MIVVLAHYQQVFWAVNSATSVLLLVLLAMRKNYRVYPAFTFYVLVNLASGGSQFLFYRHLGILLKSVVAFRMGSTARGELRSGFSGG